MMREWFFYNVTLGEYGEFFSKNYVMYWKGVKMTQQYITTLDGDTKISGGNQYFLQS